MKINGYEIALSEKKLDDIFKNQTVQFKMIDKKHEQYVNLPGNDKKALNLLVKAAKEMNMVAMEQDHHMNICQFNALKKAAKTSSHAKKALRFFKMFMGVEGVNGKDPKPIELFKNISATTGRNFYPADLTVEEFHAILEKMLKEKKYQQVENILKNRTMVRRNNDELIAIDYTVYFAKEFGKIAKHLTDAAKLVTDKNFAKYLEAQALALLENNENLDANADKLWAKLQNCNLEFTISRESYDDKMTPSVFSNDKLLKKLQKLNISPNTKDMIGIRVGIANKDGTDLILKFKSLMPKLAKLMPFAEKYEQCIKQDNKQTMIDADIVYLAGDYAQCRGGLTLAQNLPNNDKLATKLGYGRRNVYHRQVRMTNDENKVRKTLNSLVEKHLHPYFDNNTDHLFVIGHENGHSFGPNNQYQKSLGIYASIMEENKADLVSVVMMPEYVKAKVISEEELKKTYVTWCVRRLLLNAKPTFELPHRNAELMHFNYLLEKGAVSFNKKLDINFDKLHDALSLMLTETIEIQLSKSAKKAKQFIEKYTQWTPMHEKIAKTQQKNGFKPYKQLKLYF